MKALDIVIGLVLIYFLYSLLISIIGEMIASWIGMRARVLRQGLDNMLNDKRIEAFRVDLTRWIKDIFMVEPAEFKFTHAAKFYQEPGIRSLAKRGESIWYSIRNTKPSYISKSHFAATILSMLQRKGQGINEWERIKFAIETNALHFEPDTLQRFRDLLTEANGQYQLFVKGLENSYDEMMDRVNGWYKRKIGFILFWIGFVLCAALNVDTFQIVDILSKDAKVREDMVRLAESVAKDSTRISKILLSQQDSIKNYEFLKESYSKAVQDTKNAEGLMANGWEFVMVKDSLSWKKFRDIDTVEMTKMLSAYKAYAGKIDVLKQKIANTSLTIKEVKELNDVIKISKDTLGIKARGIYDLVKNNSFIFFGFSHGNIVSIELLDNKNKKMATISHPGMWKKCTYIISQLSPAQTKLWGIILSALALSLGANFWFDLLKKLVSIRSAGVKPEEKTQTKPDPTATAQLVSDGLHIDNVDPVERAIAENRKYWEGLPGFISLDKKIKDGIQGIELVFESKYDHHIDHEMTVDIAGKHKIVKVFSIKGEIPKMQPEEILPNLTLDYPDHMLYNPHRKVVGTPCGIVKNLKTGNYAILTCAHVIKTDKLGFLDDKKGSTNYYKQKGHSCW
ncbi:MAG: hypothetical protein IPO92_10410 [Saprospiraceae bacterium]|nr:hypothetical protein [Saprospiraceae bacterium]